MSESAPTLRYYEPRHTLSPKRWPWRSLLVWIAVWLAIAGAFTGYCVAETATPSWQIVDFAQMTFGIASVPTGVFVLVISLGTIFRRIRRTRAIVVLSYLEQATRLNLPIPPFLAAAVASERGRTARQLAQLRGFLADGHSIGTALAAAAPDLPVRIYGVIHAAEKSGRLAEILKREVADLRQGRLQTAEKGFYARVYLMLALLFLWWYLSNILVYLTPKISDVMGGWKTGEPHRTVLLFRVSEMVHKGRWFILAGLLILLALQLAPLVLDIFAARDRKLLPLRKFYDILLWYFPLTHLFVRDRGLGDVFLVIGAALEVGRPLPEAVHDAQGLQVNHMLDRQINRMSDAVLRGAPLAAAARQANLPPRAVAMIDTGEAADSLAATCAFLARHYRASFSRTVMIARAAMEPAVAILLGIVVYYVVRAMFDPLIDIYATFDSPGVL